MKFLESPMQTMGVGFALSVILIMGYLGMAGVAVGDAERRPVLERQRER